MTFPLVLIGSMASALLGFAAPEVIRFADGRTLEGVKEAVLLEGKVKITHSSGVSRHPVSELTPASKKELGILPEEKAGMIIPVVVEMPANAPIPRLWTISGKHFGNVRDVKILNPSEISFTHDGGVMTLRIDQLEREVRPNYGYDKAKSAAYDAQVAAIAAKKAEIEAERKILAQLVAEKEEILAAKIAEKERVERVATIKRDAVRDIYRTTYGTETYWQKSAIERQLIDAGTAAWLSRGGLSEEEIRDVMFHARYR